MKRVPKKNISLVVSDVRPPKGIVFNPAPPVSVDVLKTRASQAYHRRTRISSKQKESETKLSFNDITLPTKSKKEAKRFLSYKKNTLRLPWRLSYGIGSKLGKKTAAIISLAVIIFCVIYVVGILDFKRSSSTALHGIYADLENSAQSFKALKPETAKTSLLEANAKLLGISSSANSYGLFKLSNIFDSVFPAVGAIPQVFQNLQSFMGSLLEIASALEELKTSGLGYFLSGDGTKFLALLKTLQKNNEQVTASSFNLMNELATLKTLPLGKEFQSFNPQENLPLVTELYSAKDFLQAVILLLERPNGFHFALFFQNPSEMRPSGGFIGSYADLFIQNGSMQSIDVRDIYDPDGQLDLKVVPPKSLQGTTVSWGARDANWFFDFPKTAEKVLGFLQISKFYSEKNITFEGALALNSDIIESILGVTGPIVMPDYNLELSKDSFLAEVQKEVETGTNKALNQPKKILKDFMPLLLERLKNTSADEKEQLAKLIAENIQKKSVQVYFRDKNPEEFVKSHGLGGEVFEIPDRFAGDYLAVVNANIAGGKSDVFVNQIISLLSQIDTEGLVHNEVTIRRKHTGDTSKYSWYQASNQDYIKVYAPYGATLVSLIGDTKKTVYPQINYKHAGYATDTDVVASQNGEEFGKTFFDAWLTTSAGEEKKIVFTYDNPDKILLRNGANYTFVFDRQSGVRGGVDFTFEAPAGFKWQESNKPIYEYKNDDPDTRVTIPLTLQEI